MQIVFVRIKAVPGIWASEILRSDPKLKIIVLEKGVYLDETDLASALKFASGRVYPKAEVQFWLLNFLKQFWRNFKFGPQNTCTSILFKYFLQNHKTLVKTAINIHEYFRLRLGVVSEVQQSASKTPFCEVFASNVPSCTSFGRSYRPSSSQGWSADVRNQSSIVTGKIFHEPNSLSYTTASFFWSGD